jgi:hypothetical protein
MKKYADKKILVIDTGGLYLSVAERFVKDFGKVYYYLPNYDSSPSLNKSMVGERLAGVKVIEQWMYKWNDYKGNDGDYNFNDIDIFYFPDVYLGDVQMHLIHDCNKIVWGSRKAEELELLRYETKLKLAKIGLAVTATELCTDYKKLYTFLEKNNKPKFLKLSWFRGIIESCKFEDMLKSIKTLSKLKSSLEECYADEGENSMELLAEEPIESELEIGIDTFSIDGEIPKTIGMGYEVKNKLYITKHVQYDELPQQLKDTTFGLNKLIKQYGDNGCRSWVCTEIRIDDKKQGHLIDITMRQGSPPSELQQEWIENYSEVVFEGANGNVVEPVYKSKYAAQVAIYSPMVNDAQIIKIPNEVKQWVKIYDYCGVKKVGSQEYGIIPIINETDNTTAVGFVVGLGETIDECFAKIEEYFSKIEGEDLKLMIDHKKDADKSIKAMKKVLDIDF